MHQIVSKRHAQVLVHAHNKSQVVASAPISGKVPSMEIKAASLAAALEVIGENLRRLRESKKMTQQQVADAAKVSRNTVARYETGEVSRFEELGEICAALGVAWSEVLPDELFFKMNLEKIDLRSGDSTAVARIATKHLGEFESRLISTNVPLEFEHERLLEKEPAEVQNAVRAFQTLPLGSQALLLAAMLSRLPEPDRQRAISSIEGFVFGLRAMALSKVEQPEPNMKALTVKHPKKGERTKK